MSEAGMIISVLPPSEAVNLANEVLALVREGGKTRPIYVDANAVSIEKRPCPCVPDGVGTV